MQNLPRSVHRLLVVVAAGGAALFVLSLGFFLYAYFVWFGTSAGPWSGAAVGPIAIDLGLFSAFALHHSWLARSGVKARIQAASSPAAERIIYVWIASALFLVVCGYWQPVPGLIWRAEPSWSAAFVAVQAAGLLLTGVAARRMDVLELAGLRRVFAPRDRPSVLQTDGVYGWVRHPIYLGWLLIVWPVATMTGTRVVFAAVSTAYLAVAVVWEERELERSFGAAYTRYCRQTRWRLVPFLY